MSNAQQQNSGNPNNGNKAPVYKLDDNGVHYDVWRKTGKYGPFYEIERYKPYRDKQTGDWKKSHMFSDRGVLVAQKLETKVMKEVERFKQLDKDIAARYKDQYGDQRQNAGSDYNHQEATAELQDAQQERQAMDNNALEQARQEAFNNTPQQQPTMQRLIYQGKHNGRADRGGHFPHDFSNSIRNF